MLKVITNQGRLDRFKNCGSALWLQALPDDSEFRTTCNCCHDRFCVPCGTVRANIINDNLRLLTEGKDIRFMTLTLRHSNTPLKDQLARLFGSLSKLRERESWNQHVTGGAVFLEVKISDRDGLWHPHLHILYEGSYWENRALSTEWHAVTGDSSIVDIRQPKSIEDINRYVIKYVTKPAHQSVFTQAGKLEEMILAMAGRRLCTTIGTWRGTPLNKVKEDDRPWHTITSFEALFHPSNDQHEATLRRRELVKHNWPDLYSLFTTTRRPADSS